MEIPFVGPSYNLESRPSGVQRTVNLVPHPVEPGNDRTAWVFKDVDGLVEVVSEWPIFEPPPTVFALFHFDTTEVSLPGGVIGPLDVVNDATGATWSNQNAVGSAGIVTSAPSPKFGSHSLLGLSGLVEMGRDGVQTPPIPNEFAVEANSPFAVDFWSYAGAGLSGSSINVALGNIGASLVVSVESTGYRVVDNGNPLLDGPALVVDQWVHLRMSFNGSIIRLFINGVLVDSAPISTVAGTVFFGFSIFGGVGETIAIDELLFILGTPLSTTNFTPPTTEWTL